MASADLQKFLQKVQEDLEKSSSEFRSLVSDNKVHTFHLTRNGVYNHILFQIQADDVEIREKELKPLIDKFFDQVKDNFQNLQNVQLFDQDFKADEFSVTLQAKSRTRGPLPNLDARKTFDFIKYAYRTPLQTLKSELKKYYRKSGQQLNDQRFVDLGHAKDSSVVQQRVNQLLEFGQIPKSLANIPELKNLLALTKDDDNDTVTVTLESAVFNRAEGRGPDKQLKEKVQRQLAKVLEKMDTMELKGSDSFRERKEKELLAKVVSEFRKIDGVEIQIDKNMSKVKKSSKTPAKRQDNSKVVHAKSRGMVVQAARIQSNKKKKITSVSPVNLLSILNAKLPQTVAGNMGEPRLVNRTGTFAGSVKATDISQTKKGFLSIGYTYEKSPYGVFETTSGTRFASANRDPRPLIEGSIREIAQQLIGQRFYTRRL